MNRSGVGTAKVAKISFFPSGFRNHTKTYRTTVRQREQDEQFGALDNFIRSVQFAISGTNGRRVSAMAKWGILFFFSQSSPSGVFYYKLDRLSLTTHSHERYHAKLLSTEGVFSW